MPEFDIDEFLKKKRNRENLFGVIKDRKTGSYISYPSIPISKVPKKEQTPLKEPVKPEKEPIEIIKPEISETETVLEKTRPVVKAFYEDDSQHSLMICFWQINLPYGMDWDIPWQIQKWLDTRIDVKESAKIWLNRDEEEFNPPILYLTVAGKGKDKRCTWCKSYWTAFTSYSEERSFDINKQNTCRYNV